MSSAVDVDRVPFLDLGAAHDEVRADLAAAFTAVVDRGVYVRGAECELFEQEWAAYCGTEHCVGTGNGLDALTLALRALGVGPGDEVIVPGHTFIATWLAVEAVGAVPVGVDVLPDRPVIDPRAVAAAVTPRTAAVVPVHLYGHVAPMAELCAIAERAGIAVVEDAAQAHGAEADGIRAGAFGHAAAFSFYPGKNLGALGDGGAVTTRSAEVADRVRMLANYGSRTKYHHESSGVNSRLDELQAAFLRVKLPKLDDWNARRRTTAAVYEDALRAAGGAVRTVPVAAGTTSSHHLEVVRLPERDRVRGQMDRAGVECSVHYPVPPHLSGAYSGRSHPAGGLPVSEAWCRDVLSLPTGPGLTVQQAERVVHTLLEVAR
ncbi:DegT/DnrJ/EryC1/StrS family aminotransferase [Streptomyces sp. NP160]|uniref:DegT/DnrJ/EryC1/StrS family aminotransferase n=1 Tax=Streptomyces sp. NP160 TaxID=2586637 RepID=UPI00111B8EE3|nr:DegT/DnrJ/EryC1/StrS family aminotransferase [Streptomyces sp. NP160]TNM69377.1 DegT/DnrJ/EryC1/StrS family aminotransferase [Streptomyces sp. NP160]